MGMMGYQHTPELQRAAILHFLAVIARDGVMDGRADKVTCLLMSRRGGGEPGWCTDSRA